MLNRKVVAWALYDWANSAFALSVLAALFPLFFGAYWSAGELESDVTSRLATITAIANAVVAVAAPVLGVIADAGGYRKRFLIMFATCGAVMTGALGLVGEGQWVLAAAFYVLASIGFQSSNSLYDSLLVDVTEPRYFNVVSSIGYSMGYLGGATLLALHAVMLMSPDRFGFAGTDSVFRFAFVSVGAWWALFLAPLVMFVPEATGRVLAAKGIFKNAYRDLRQTVAHIGQYRQATRFLVAYCIYLAGVYTVIVMAANYGTRLGFASTDLVKALMITNFAGFPATIAVGYLGQRIGAKQTIGIALLVYVAVSIWAVRLETIEQFFVMAIVVGCVQGGVQALSRSLYATLIPNDKPGEFFGFYNLVTKVAYVIGPTVIAVITMISTEPTMVIAGVLPLFVVGGLLLLRVTAPTAKAVS
ncbi:MAG: MFS transporter [Pseudomonadota bacterium]